MIYIILNWNNHRLTERCLSYVLKFETESSILLVDNGSTGIEKDGILSLASRIGFVHIMQDCELPLGLNIKQRQLIFLELKQNYGYAIGNNYGLKICKTLGFIHAIIMNNDVFILNNIADMLKEHLDNNKEVAVIGVDVIQDSISINPLQRTDTYFFLFWYKLF
jgi:GT2 family glycosyltransferase